MGWVLPPLKNISEEPFKILTTYTKGVHLFTKDGFFDQFFPIFEIINFCFAVDISDLVHDVEAIDSLY